MAKYPDPPSEHNSMLNQENHADAPQDSAGPASDGVIESLQRSIRRLHWMMAALLLLVVFILAKTMEPRIRKRELILIDAGGVPRAVLGTRDNAPFLSMHDPGGAARIAIGVDKDGPMLRLSDTSGTTHAGLWLQADGSRLAMVNADGAGIQIRSNARDARIHFQDDTGWPRLGLGVDDGSPFIGLMETNLVPRIVIGADKSGGRLSFFGDDSTRLLMLGVHENRPFLNPVAKDY